MTKLYLSFIVDLIGLIQAIVASKRVSGRGQLKDGAFTRWDIIIWALGRSWRWKAIGRCCAT